MNQDAALNITNGGLLTVGETLIVDVPHAAGTSINMTSGGMLALYGEANSSLADFLALIDGPNAITDPAR